MSTNKNNFIDEALLLEKTRKELIDKSKNADIVKTYGSTRYERRTHQHIVNSIEAFNKIDMNALFRANLLSFKIPVKGETDTYDVEVLFEGICDDIKHEIAFNKNILEFKCVYKALLKAIDRQNILIACTCPDWKYRQSYWSTKGQYNGGSPEVRASTVTNPNDSKGAGCKHVMTVLSNLDWAVKLATSIYNYILYMEKNWEPKFAGIIFPKLFTITYEAYIKGKSQYGYGDEELANAIDKEEDQALIKNINSYNPDVEEPEEEPEEINSKPIEPVDELEDTENVPEESTEEEE